MKLRYLTTMRNVTAEEVESYAREHNLPKMMVKQTLQNKVGPVLEYYDEDTKTWYEVKHVTEYVG